MDTTTYLARLSTDETTARRIANTLAETLDPDAAVTAIFEEAQGRWAVEVHLLRRPDQAALRALLALAAGQAAARALKFSTVEASDWVKASLAGLEPVAAGRFVVYGRHHRARVAANRIGIEIEAGLAFGTGHHGTTRGCLIALDTIVKTRKPIRSVDLSPLRTEPASHLTRGRPPKRSDGGPVRGKRPPSRPSLYPLPNGEREQTRKARVLDVGTGSGVLAIAAAKALRLPVLASDIDRTAVAVAQENVRANGAGSLIGCVHATDLVARRIRAHAPYELAFANILLVPLKRLAQPMAPLLAPKARVVLSGLLPQQANAARAAYGAHGLTLDRRILLEGWMTLVMSRRNVRRHRRG